MQVKKTYLVVILNLLLVCIGFAQRRDLNRLSDEKKLLVAKKLIEEGGYYAAIGELNGLVQSHPENDSYMFELAEAYFYSRDYENAEKWYGNVVAYKDPKSRKRSAHLSSATFQYGESLKHNGKYEQALGVFQLFINENLPNSHGNNYHAWAKEEVISCEFALNNKDRFKNAYVSNLGSNVNSAYSDFSPVLENDSTLLFSSIRKDSVILLNYGDQNFDHTKIYTTTFSDNLWQKPTLKKDINSKFEHNGNGSYSPDGKRFYFTRCRKVKGQSICQIFVSNVTKIGFSKPRKLEGHVNHAGHSSTHPFSVKTTIDKAEHEVLFFASNIRGSNGGMDIWYSVIDANGKAAQPINCGHTVNTSRDEITPYYDSENNILYFSSNAHFGFGGFDVFRTHGSNNKYDNLENMLEPINSSLDDVYYRPMNKDKFKGHLVSNRPGGMALLSPTCCDDIYSFESVQPTIMVLEVSDALTGAALKDVQLKISVKSMPYKQMPDSLLFSISDEAMDKMVVKTDTSLLENLYMSKKPNKFYVLDSKNIIHVSVEKKGYEKASAIIRTNTDGMVDSVHLEKGNITKIGNNRFLTLKLSIAPLSGQIVAEKVKKDTTRSKSSLHKEFAKAKKRQNKELPDLENDSFDSKGGTQVHVVEFPLTIHFQFNTVDIVEADQPILDSLVEILKSDSRIKIDFTTHTDWFGSDEYNMKLSYKRATFIKNYIALKGISLKRISGHGLGETIHVAPNAHPDGSDNPEGRQLNRRTNIKLISSS